MEFQKPSIHDSNVVRCTKKKKSVINEQTDGQAQSNLICPPASLKLGA